MKQIIVAMRGGYDENGETSQRLEPQLCGWCNTLTSVQKDNMVLKVSDETVCSAEISEE